MGRNLSKCKKVDDDKVFIVSFVFGWIKLNFAVRGNFRLLISNLNSKTQYRFKILRKCHFRPL